MKSPTFAPYRGVRASADPGADVVLRAILLAPRLPPRAFFFGRTAAALHRLPVPVRFSTETAIHVAVRAGDRRVDSLGVVAHHIRIASEDVGVVRSIPATTAARTWCDLATAGFTLGELVAAGDRIIWRRSPRAHLAELRSCVGRYEGRRGARLMRQALELLDGDSDSAPESELRVAIVLAGFPTPAVNLAVDDGRGGLVRPDLSWPTSRVAIEYEGDHHRTDRRQWHHDIQRSQRLEDAGWAIFRATAEDHRSPHHLLLWRARRLGSS